MNKWLLAVVFMSICVVTQIIFLLISVANIRNTVDKYKVEESKFKFAIGVAVSNYLDHVINTSFVSTQDVELVESKRKINDPTVVTVELGTWPNGCMINGVCLKVGDFCDYGVIVSIRPGVVYCRDADNNITIMRNSRKLSASAPPARPRAADAGDDSENSRL